jgi:glyoxylase-like metal-dependent hydrolase (beta-lactamase superfamily II)
MEISDDVFVLPSRPAFAFNCYLADGVLIDAATRWAWPRMARALRGRSVAAHALTHAHPDHQGSSAGACRELGVPFWVSEVDAPFAAAGGPAVARPKNPITRLQGRLWAGPGRAVDRVLREGDAVGSFVVLPTPGHTDGHLAFWRERDRVLIAGDVFFGRHPLTGKPGVYSPPGLFTSDPDRNRQSMRLLAELRPRITCFGHGPPVRDPGVLASHVDQLA